MKKIFLLIILGCAFSTLLTAQQKKPSTAKASSTVLCCPEFDLAMDYTPGPGCRTNCKSDGNPAGGTAGGSSMIASCRSTHLYTVIPNLIASGYSYTWTITGGTPTSATGNPVNITWNAGTSVAQIKVVISGPGGCNKTIIKNICLVDGPVATITNAAPNPVCINTAVNFSAANTTTMSYNWDFGDNSYGMGQNVTHTYSSTGPKTVILTVRGDTAQGGCGCIDTDTIIVNVNNGNGLQINPISCKKMFCPGDTATYCAVNCTGPYTWTIVGGTPSTYTGNCVKVTWNASSPVPASITVTAANCPGGCGNTATIQVPVLFPNLQINGVNLPDKVCPGSTTNYSLPSMPGAFYKWTVSGGGTIIGPDSNVNVISISWFNSPVPGGPYQVICNYHNPLTGCKGADTMNVLVRPPFLINGPTSSCVGYPFSYFNSSITPGSALWTISPSHPFTPTGATPSISGTWSAPGTYAINATPVVGSDYCTPSASLVVTVNPVPVITAINTVSPICKGSTHVYTVTSSMPGAGQYTWTITGGLAVLMGAHNDSAQVTWDNSGVYSISVTQTVAGCTSPAFTVTVPVIANPTITPNPGPFCMDANSNFTASPVLGPGNYTWSINNNLGSLMSPQGTNTMNVQWNGGISPGIAPAIITVTNFCGVSASTNVNVITPNAISITQSGDLCNPTGMQLTATPGFTGYVWSGPSVSGPSGNTANALAPGLYTVTAMDANGCTVKALTHVLPKNLPAVTISTASVLVYCPGDPVNVTLSASFSSSYTGCSYQWYQNGNPIPGATGITLNIPPVALQNNPGSNTFYVIVKCGGCSVISNTKTVTVLANCPPLNGCPFAHAKIANKPAANATFAAIPGLGDVSITGPANNSTLCGGTGTFTSVYNLYQNTFSVAAAWWDFGDGYTSNGTQTGSGMGPYNNTATHSYANCGSYMVVMHVIVQCSPTTFCLMTDTITVKVPAVAKFIPTVVCDKVYLQDQSSVCQTSCNFTYTWSATGPGTVSFSPAATGLYSSIANTTVMTASASGTYTITLTLSSASCGCTGPNAAVYTQMVTISLPSASFPIPTAACAGTAINFTASGAVTYNWNFYGMYQSNMASTYHSFPNPPPGVQPVTLTVTDASGCSASITQNVTVLPPLTVAIAGAQDICPGQSVTLTTNPALFQTYQWYHDGVQAGTSASLVVSTPGEYWVEVSSNSGGCKATSPKVTIKYKHAPIAKIKKISRVCIGTGGSLSLENIIQELNTNYTWSLYSGPTTVTFSPNGTNAAYQTTATPGSPLAGDYIIILTATDITSGCSTNDTICIKAYNPPAFSVSGTGGCAGINHTFIASPAATYNYLWTNGVTGNIMTTSLAGAYSVTATDPISGCISTKPAGIINPAPDVSLFPRSDCDTLCDTVKLVPPLPLGPFQTYGIYTIKWYDGATLIYTGPFLNMNTLVPNPGQHNIHIVVTNSFGCSATSGNYNVYVHPCNGCNCKGSKWDGITLTEGDHPVEPVDPKASIVVPTQIKLECKGTYELTCNKPYTVNAGFVCPDTCKGKVTASLQPPSGMPVTGTAPFTFTPTQNGIYVLTLYGWCGDKICDSCVIKFKVKCVPCECNPKTDLQLTIAADGKIKKINCDTDLGKLDCNKTFVLNGTYTCNPADCPSSLNYTINGPGGYTASGTLPLTINTNTLANGSYTIVIQAYCNGKLCKECKIVFTVDCEKPCNPCEITVTPKDATYTAGNGSTIVNNNFSISIPAAANITEVRANVISYTIDDNYKKECMQCVNLPFTWASISTATNINAASPQITMYGGASVPSFNGSGAGAYQNPREVIWNNGSNLNVPNISNIGIGFILPPTPTIDCCELKGRICVKFTFRDNQCMECEVIACFDVVIKKK